MTPTLTQKLAAIRQECERALELAENQRRGPYVFSNQYDGLPLYALSQDNEICLSSKSETEIRAAVFYRNFTPAFAKAVLTMLEALTPLVSDEHACDNDGRGCGACEAIDRVFQTLADQWPNQTTK